MGLGALLIWVACFSGGFLWIIVYHTKKRRVDAEPVFLMLKLCAQLASRWDTQHWTFMSRLCPRLVRCNLIEFGYGEPSASVDAFGESPAEIEMGMEMLSRVVYLEVLRIGSDGKGNDGLDGTHACMHDRYST
ncbi:hypothetical protein VTL71DRAFT_5342 [Oculimacula yallundae]|uniref:Uncharacterized protein n=1 Tax=Oculimacula yallundae TaxID=86028 RepID=A0ABR4C1F8_9HELO